MEVAFRIQGLGGILRLGLEHLVLSRLSLYVS
jgi:hypothetical protein